MAAWARIADDAKTRLVAWLGGPGAVPLLTTSRAESSLLQTVQLQRRRLHLALRPLWTQSSLGVASGLAALAGKSAPLFAPHCQLQPRGLAPLGPSRSRRSG